eukprot:g4943.t1
MRRVSIGPTTSISEVAQVAAGAHVDYDTSNEISSLGFPPTEHRPHRSLSISATRAIVFLRLATLSRSKTPVDSKILCKLTSFLNGNSKPLATADQDSVALQYLTELLFEPSSLSSSDRLVFISGSCVCAGLAALNVHFGAKLLTVSTALVGLSCEALSADIKVLDPQRLESYGNKNAVEVSETLKNALTGSQRVNKKQGVGCVKGISDVPMLHGAALDALQSCQVGLRVELNAQALDAKALHDFPTDVSQSFHSQLESVTRSFVDLVELSFKRSQLLLNQFSTLTPLTPSVSPEEVPAEKELTQMKEEWSEKLNSIRNKFLDQKRTFQSLILTIDDVKPSAGMANLAYDILWTLCECFAIEYPLVLTSLRILEGPTPALDSSTSAGGTKKEKKKKGQGLTIGQGNASIRSLLEQKLMQQTNPEETENPILSIPWPLEKNIEMLSNGAKKLLDIDQGQLGQLVELIHKENEQNQVRRKPKIPKGSRDFLPEQMKIRERVFDKITSVFKRHGAVSIDTPVFELKETLTGKYGEDSKLIYDLADQGGELLSLRYDLTVPFARYVALHSVGNIKRYHIGKVYRRDQPQMTRGRFREFFQCDFDIAGSYSTMVPDSECVKVLVEILEDLSLGDFEVKVNHRRLIDAMMDICGVPANQHRAICSSIDKLDKESWETVKTEMVMEKGLPSTVADQLGEFVKVKDTPDEFIRRLSEPNHPFMKNTQATQAIEELNILVDYLEQLEALDHIIFDLSLARGLDYYSGLIYEAVYKNASTGSVAAGGRYDKLVGMFSGKDVPAVGVSIGVERVFSIMEQQVKSTAETEGTVIRTCDTQVLVASIGNGLQGHRMNLCAQLWSAGIAAEFGYKPNPKMGDQLNYALQQGIPFMVLFGEDELSEGVVKIKDLDARIEDTVPEEKLVTELRSRLSDLQDMRELAGKQ